MSRLEGKVAVITGGAHGLGEAVARHMSEHGASIAVLDRDPRGAEVVEKLGAEGIPAWFYRTDVTDEDDVREAFADLAQRFGRVHALVNSAGVEGTNKPADELELPEWEQSWRSTTRPCSCAPSTRSRICAAVGAARSSTSRRSTARWWWRHPAVPRVEGRCAVDEQERRTDLRPGWHPGQHIHPRASSSPRSSTGMSTKSGMDRSEARAALDALHPLGGAGSPTTSLGASSSWPPTRPDGSPAASW